MLDKRVFQPPIKIDVPEAKQEFDMGISRPQNALLLCDHS